MQRPGFVIPPGERKSGKLGKKFSRTRTWLVDKGRIRAVNRLESQPWGRKREGERGEGGLEERTCAKGFRLKCEIQRVGHSNGAKDVEKSTFSNYKQEPEATEEGLRRKMFRKPCLLIIIHPQ